MNRFCPGRSWPEIKRLPENVTVRPMVTPPIGTSLPNATPKAAFSADLHAVAVHFEARSAQLGELLEATKGRGYHLLLFVVALPFVGPVPLPGFSIPFGLAIAVIGARMAVNRTPWLPGWLLHRRLPPRVLAQTLRGAGRIVTALEGVSRPRLSHLSGAYGSQRLSGVLITASGLFMTLPLPLPFSNSLPAWTVLFLTAAALADDGLMLLGGVAVFAVTTAFFVFVAIGGGHLVAWFLQA
jgi:hypothetical protein